MQKQSAVDGAPLALPVKATCKRLGVCEATGWKFIRLGKIRVIRIGGRTLIPAAEVERILEEGLN